ncbi:MAG: ATP-binding protein [Deferribacteres bacterium]|nr:ATP-binding protein [Deferribacteres bacterium]
MWITRNAERLIRQLGRQFPVVFVTGARQAGKTSILTHIYPDYTYVTLDDPDRAAEAENAPSDFLGSLPRPVIIDEAQYVPRLFRHIKIIVDKVRKHGQFFITGSQNFSLMQNLTESLAGRCGIVSLQTLSADELKKSGVMPSIEKYISTGGFPALYSVRNINVRHWYPSYIATYLERDVRNIINVGNLRDFNRFLRASAARTAQTLSLSDLARDVGVAPNTVKSWLSVLQASHIIYLLEPYYRNIGKRLVKSPKLYFLDTGLAAHLTGLYSWQEIFKSPLAGALWETYAFNQILRCLLRHGISTPPLYYWRTSNGRETDFIIEKGGRFIAFEAKLTGSPTTADLNGFRALEEYYGGGSLIKGFLICRIGKTFSMAKNIRAINGTVISL